MPYGITRQRWHYHLYPKLVLELATVEGWPRHCCRGAQSVPKAAYRSGCRDKPPAVRFAVGLANDCAIAACMEISAGVILIGVPKLVIKCDRGEGRVIYPPPLNRMASFLNEHTVSRILQTISLVIHRPFPRVNCILKHASSRLPFTLLPNESVKCALIFRHRRYINYTY